MNRLTANRSWPAIPGVTAIVFGVLIISLNESSTPSIWLGTGVLFLGLLTTVVSVYNHKSSGSYMTDNVYIGDDSEGTSIHSAPVNRTGRLSGHERTSPFIGELTASFLHWFEGQKIDQSLRPVFDRWVREVLQQYFEARRVRCFQITDNGRRLSSLSDDPEDAIVFKVKTYGLIEQVLSSGLPYVQGALGNGPLVEQLADEWTQSADKQSGTTIFPRPDWLIPIRKQNKAIGLIVVGELSAEKMSDIPLLTNFGHLLEMYWCHIDLACSLSAAEQMDRASGVLNRIDLTNQAEAILAESSSDDEPLVALVLSIEGVRRLDDKGQWELRDWLMQQIGQVLRSKVRSDDLVGRFSDDKFVVILRRLNTSLGGLIAKKLLEAVTDTLSGEPDISSAVKLRCGLADGAGDGFDPLLERTFEALRQARIDERDMMIVSATESDSYVGNSEVKL
ncbi:MAG: GGDEF domain-containing protein [Planctomycetota bacterium]|jgi:diguanylate cyclase (GGDEF)-like protein